MRVRALILVLVVCVAIPTVASAQTSSGKFTALTEASNQQNGNSNIIINFFGKNPAESVNGYQFGVSNVTSSAGGGGAGTGKVTFSDLTFVKPVTPLSLELFTACATGKHIKEVTIDVSSQNAKGQKIALIQIKLMDVLVSSYSSSGGGDVPLDSISLNFASMTYTVN